MARRSSHGAKNYIDQKGNLYFYFKTRHTRLPIHYKEMLSARQTDFITSAIITPWLANIYTRILLTLIEP